MPRRTETIDAAMFNEITVDALLAQLGCPTGEAGKAVDDMMERMNAALIEAAYRKLDPKAGDRILEIGLGNGGHVASVLGLAPLLTLTGVDVSPSMIAAARSRNTQLIQSGQLHLHTASVNDMPFSSDVFDKAISINTVYFWPNLTAGLRKIRRVLADDGILLIVAVTPETSLAMPLAEHGIQIYCPTTFRRACFDAGFDFVQIGRYTDRSTAPAGSEMSREFMLVRASCR